MSDIQILGSNGKPLPQSVRSVSRARARMNVLRSGSAYQGGGYDHASTMGWNASRLSGQAASTLSRETLNARTRDLIRNDSNVAAGMDRKVNNTVGAGLRLAAKPDYRLLNMTADQAEAVSDIIEAHWQTYSDESGLWCDVERQGNAADLLLLQAHHLEAEGEGFGIIVWRDEPAPTGFHTAMQVVHPSRCSNPNNLQDRPDLIEGVQLDEYGAPIGYHFRAAHPGDFFATSFAEHFTWEYFDRDFEDGRPYVVHIKERNEAGMTRGFSKLWSMLRKQKQGEQYFDYELQASALNAVMALFIETPLDMFAASDALTPDAVGSMADENSEYHDLNPITAFDGVQPNILAPGEKPTLTKPEHPNAAFDGFMKNVLRSLASVMGLTYEQLTMDWSEVNYSSARAAILEVAKGFKVVRKKLEYFMNCWYRAWLQELFDLGLIALPSGVLSFDDAPEAWCQCEWIGAGKGYVDPLKEVQAAGLRVTLGLSSMEKECAEQGEDYKKLISQIVKELRIWRAALEDAGLDPNMVPHPAYGGVPTATKLADSIAANPPEADNDLSGKQEKSTRRSRSGVPLISNRARSRPPA